MPQVISIKTSYTSKRTSFFTVAFFKTYFQIAEEDFNEPIKQLHYQFRSQF